MSLRPWVPSIPLTTWSWKVSSSNPSNNNIHHSRLWRKYEVGEPPQEAVALPAKSECGNNSTNSGCSVPPLSKGSLSGQHSGICPWSNSSWTRSMLPGWKRVEGRLGPQWVTIPQVAAGCQELVKCGCWKPCSPACRCNKTDLRCKAFCKCQCRSLIFDTVQGIL